MGLEVYQGKVWNSMLCFEVFKSKRLVLKLSIKKRLTFLTAPLVLVFAALPVNQNKAYAMTLPSEDINSVIKINNSKDIYNIAVKYLGTPYCHGGSSPKCFDCSGFTKYIFAQEGIDLARTTNGQKNQARRISKSKAVKGDLVFFMTSSGYVYHVGIYVGNGKILHSPKRGHRVRIENIWSSNVSYGRL